MCQIYILHNFYAATALISDMIFISIIVNHCKTIIALTLPNMLQILIFYSLETNEST